MTEEIIVLGYSLPINLFYKDAIKVDWLANPNAPHATRVANAALEFHPYFVFEYILDIIRKDPIGGIHSVKDSGIYIVDALNGLRLFPANAEITKIIDDLKTVEAVLNNKIILNGDYEVGIIDDKLSLKKAMGKVLEKVVSANTQKASYYTSNGKIRKIPIRPRPSEVKINRKRLIYVPKWIITIKAGEHSYNREALTASYTFTVDEIAFCLNHFTLGKIWSTSKQTSAVCEICGGAFCDDHISYINNTYYCEKHRSSDQDSHQTSSNSVFNQNKLSKLTHEGDLSYDPGFYKQAIKLYDEARDDTYNAKDWNRKGKILYNLKNYDEAIKCYDKAIEINPNDADPWEGKGNALYGLGKYKEAKQAWHVWSNML